MEELVEFICPKCQHKWTYSKEDIDRLEKLSFMRDKLRADPMCGCDRFGTSYLEEAEEAAQLLENIKKCPLCERFKD